MYNVHFLAIKTVCALRSVCSYNSCPSGEEEKEIVEGENSSILIQLKLSLGLVPGVDVAYYVRLFIWILL